MANLNNRKALHPLWTQWGLGVLDAFANCIVAIYDPNSATNGDDYDPYGNNSTSAPTLIWQGAGQLQVFRQALTVDDVAGSVSQVRSIRFTVPLDGPQVPVRKGLIVRVVSSPHEPDAEKYEYTVASGINSGLAWKRTIEAESDLAVISDPITEIAP